MSRIKIICASLALIGLVTIVTIGARKLKPFTPAPANITTSVRPTGFNKQLHSIDQHDSLWFIVNKSRPLPATYQPANLRAPSVKLRLSVTASEMLLREQATTELEKLVTTARQSGLNIRLLSGYRSYSLQSQVYNSNVASQGRTSADRNSARPGHSEHQTGLAADVGGQNGCDLEVCFGNTPEGLWLAAHVSEFGFIIRYPAPDKEPITGYQYEPWHLRYVGSELAVEIKKTGQTLEEFFNLPPAPNY